MTTHSMKTALIVAVRDGSEHEIDATIVYNFIPGAPAYTPRGEYAPIDPPYPPEIDILEILVDISPRLPMAKNECSIFTILRDDESLRLALIEDATKQEPSK